MLTNGIEEKFVDEKKSFTDQAVFFRDLDRCMYLPVLFVVDFKTLKLLIGSVGH